MALAIADHARWWRLLGGALNAFMISPARLPAADRDPRDLLALPRRGRRPHSRHRELLGPPTRFLFLGQGYVGGFVPTQLVLLVAAILGFGWWLHRTGHGTEPLRDRLLARRALATRACRWRGGSASLYVLSGLLSGLAAVVYVAHLGQAKADAGTGFELMAITAVVLGRRLDLRRPRHRARHACSASLAIVVLQNGLRLSGAPAELARHPHGYTARGHDPPRPPVEAIRGRIARRRRIPRRKK